MAFELVDPHGHLDLVLIAALPTYFRLHAAGKVAPYATNSQRLIFGETKTVLRRHIECVFRRRYPHVVTVVLQLRCRARHAALPYSHTAKAAEDCSGGPTDLILQLLAHQLLQDVKQHMLVVLPVGQVLLVFLGKAPAP